LIRNFILITSLRGYSLWGDDLGGITPCFSTLSTYLAPPPITVPATATLSTSQSVITSTIVNVVYARNYPVTAQNRLNTGAKAGIGVGAGVAGLASLGLLIFLLRRCSERRRRENSWYVSGGPTSPYDSGLSHSQPP
jgi:hypothetical protein